MPLSPLLLLLASTSAFAVPQTLAHQGRLLDATGAPLSGAHDLHVAFYDESDALTWSEDLSAVAFESGYFSVQLGLNSPIDLSTIDVFQIGLSLDGGDELTPRVPLNSVPYALVAQSVQGGVIDASEIRVGGERVFSGQGIFEANVPWSQVANPPQSGADLSGLSCADHEHVALINGGWSCVGESAHNHDASDLQTGLIAKERLQFGTSIGTIAEGDHLHTPDQLGAASQAELLTHTQTTDAHHALYTNDQARAAVGAQPVDLGAGSTLAGVPLRANTLYTKTLIIDGDPNTFYPVIIDLLSDRVHVHRVHLYRNYAEPGPDTWNTATHRGGLELEIETNIMPGWSGMPATNRILNHNYTYTPLVGHVGSTAHGYKMAVWLRGGGAVYHLESDLQSIESAVIVYADNTQTFDHVNNAYDTFISPMTAPPMLKKTGIKVSLHSNAYPTAITRCALNDPSGSVVSNFAPTHFYHSWTGSDCDNGLPSGHCVGFLEKAQHGGSDQDWMVIRPGEPIDGDNHATLSVNGGMSWWTNTPNGSVIIAATYFCTP